MVGQGRTLPGDLVEFFESGVSILVGTRDAGLRPSCARAMGAAVHESKRTVTIHLPEAVSARTVENLRDNGRIAVTFSRPLTHYSIQIKGTCTGVRPSGDDDRAVQQRYRAAYFEQLHAVGLPRAVSGRIVFWPSIAIDLEVHGIFVQTPGPTAGRRLEA
jgi:hypothetical protein